MPSPRNTTTADLMLHEEASRVPEMRPAEFVEFLSDVRERGIRVPLELIPGTSIVIDGRSRLRAARELGLSQIPVVDANTDGDDPVVYMLRAASQRRHLTDGQRACMAEEERDWLAEQGRKARKEHLRRGVDAGDSSPVEAPLAPTENSQPAKPRERARAVAAKKHNVSEKKTRTAGDVKKKNPAAFEKVKSGELTLSQAKREVERDDRQKELQAKAKLAEAERSKLKSVGEKPWRLIAGDCIAELKKLPAASVRLIFADPPYNIGRDYHGQGAAADSHPDEAYLAFCQEWMRECVRVLTDDGSLWVMISDDYADDFGVLLRRVLKLNRRAWIKWYETFGVNRANNFNRTSRHIFYMTKDEKRFVFNASAVNRPSDRQLKYNDKRADPGGKTLDDVWGIPGVDELPRLVGTASEKIPGFDNQLPVALVRRIVECASDPGDTMLDPFNGTGTSGVAAVLSGRRYIGIEKNAKAVEVAETRITGEYRNVG